MNKLVYTMKPFKGSRSMTMEGDGTRCFLTPRANVPIKAQSYSMVEIPKWAKKQRMETYYGK